MGQIVSSAAKPKRCNANQLSQVPTPAAGEHILVSSDNSMNAAGQGNFDSYIVGDGTTAATVLELKYINEEHKELSSVKIPIDSTESGKYLNGSGVIKENSTWKMVLFDVSNYSVINVKAPSNATQTTPFSAFLDSSQGYVSDVTRTDRLISGKTFSVPASAKYFAMSMYTGVSSANISIDGTLSNSIKGKVDALLNEVPTIELNITALNQEVGIQKDVISYIYTGYVLTSSMKLATTSATVSAMMIKLHKGDIVNCTFSPATIKVGYTTENLDGKTIADIYNDAVVFQDLGFSGTGAASFTANVDGYYVINEDINTDITIERATRIDDIEFEMGNLGDLQTQNKGTLVGAINEVAQKSEMASGVGDVADLETEDKTSVVAAINELKNNEYTPSTSYSGLATQEITNDDDTYTLDEELAGSGTWSLGNGWSGNASDGFTYNGSGDGELSLNIPSLEAGHIYLICFAATNTNTQGFSSVLISLGGSLQFQTYRGGGNVNMKWAIRAGSADTNLTFSVGTWSGGGTLSNVSVKEILTSGKPHVIYRDSENVRVVDIIATKDIFKSILIGSRNTFGVEGEGNVGVGCLALSKVLTGFWNSAIGRQALENVENGSRNIAIGYIALQHLVSGHRNIAIGTFAMEGLVSGSNNIAIGADAMQNCNGFGNVGIGTRAGVNTTNGERNTSVGYNSFAANTTGKANVAIGANCLAANVTGNFNVSVGTNTYSKPTSGSYNTMVGGMAAEATSGSGNTMLGYQAGGTDTKTCTNVVSIGRGTTMSAGAENSIAIGYNAAVTKSNQCVIGNGDTSEFVLGNKKIVFNQDGTVSWETIA